MRMSPVLGAGEMPVDELARTFNCGIGMAVIVAPDDADDVTSHLEGAGETVSRIGLIDQGQRGCTVNGPNRNSNCQTLFIGEKRVIGSSIEAQRHRGTRIRK